jgi:hypothetical protein
MPLVPVDSSPLMQVVHVRLVQSPLIVQRVKYLVTPQPHVTPVMMVQERLKQLPVAQIVLVAMQNQPILLTRLLTLVTGHAVPASTRTSRRVLPVLPLTRLVRHSRRLRRTGSILARVRWAPTQRTVLTGVRPVRA